VRRSPLALALPAAALVALTGGTVAFVGLDKTVTVRVDDASQQVRTFAGDVAGALDRAGIKVGAHDTVAPDLSAPVRNGSTIVIRRGRLLSLVLDGHPRTVWVTARSVDEALGQLALRDTGEWVSASRSTAIPRSGLSLAVRTPQRVTILVDGRRVVHTTTAPTVAQFLRESKVTLRQHDKLSVPDTLYPTTGLVVRVMRVDQRIVEDDQAIAFDTVRRPTSALYKGQTRVVRPGTAGLRVVKWRLTWKDHRIVGRTLLVNRVTAKPSTQIEEYGTKDRPAYSPSADGLNWAALANCESGGNPREVSSNGMYRGLYQFTIGTWQSVGGQGDPIDASPSEQTYRAQVLFRREGTSPWPVCGHYLYS
jgi:uncharacterized protein YabE (DUF348 family)